MVGQHVEAVRQSLVRMQLDIAALLLQPLGVREGLVSQGIVAGNYDNYFPKLTLVYALYASSARL
jgi:hypothetical protein